VSDSLVNSQHQPLPNALNGRARVDLRIQQPWTLNSVRHREADRGRAVAVMLLIGLSACTAVDPSSVARPTVPLGSATGMATMWPAEPGRSATGMPAIAGSLATRQPASPWSSATGMLAAPGSLVTRRPASPRSSETMAFLPPAGGKKGGNKGVVVPRPAPHY
jgi:hypothetical protein